MSFIISNARFHANEAGNIATDRRHFETIADDHQLPAPPPLELAVLKPENKLPFKRSHLTFSVDHNGAVFQSSGNSNSTLATTSSSATPTPPPPPLLNVSTIARRQDSPARIKKDELVDLRDCGTDRLIDVENSDPQAPNSINRNSIAPSDLCSAFVKLDPTAFPFKSHGTISVSTIGSSHSSPTPAASAQTATFGSIEAPSTAPRFEVSSITPVTVESKKTVDPAAAKDVCSDEDFWRYYGPQMLYDSYGTHFENRTYRVYVGREGDQARVYKPIGIVRKTESVLCRVLGVYCDFADSLSAQQVQAERSGRLRDFLWPLSANKHIDNLATIRRLIRENPVSDQLPYVDLPDGVIPAKSFSIRVKRKQDLESEARKSSNFSRPNVAFKSNNHIGLESHDYCVSSGDKEGHHYEYLEEDLNDDEMNPLCIDTTKAIASEYNENDRKDSLDNHNELDEEDDINDEDLLNGEETSDEIVCAEKEMILLAKLAKQTENELKAVATGLKRFSKEDSLFGDSDDGKQKKRQRAASGKGIQPAHCPYCMQLFSATFNAKLHYNGRYKGNGKHISCKKRQEMGDQNLNPIVCLPNCIVCKVRRT